MTSRETNSQVEKSILPVDFYKESAIQTAKMLIGKYLIRIFNGKRLVGIILETEAYDGEHDQACHARTGRTQRNAAMYGPPGHAYIYFTYGMHWMLNCVTGSEGYPAAVLIRTILPIEGLDVIAKRRKGIPKKHWCDGPAKLTKALAIDGILNNANLCSNDSGLFIERGIIIKDQWIKRTPRIGINFASEPWRSKLWRFIAVLPEEWRL